MPMKEKILMFEAFKGTSIRLEIAGRDQNPASLIYLIGYKYIGENPDNPEPVVKETPIDADIQYTGFWEQGGGYCMEEEPHSRYYPYPHILALIQDMVDHTVKAPYALVLTYYEKNSPSHRRTTITKLTILFKPNKLPKRLKENK